MVASNLHLPIRKPGLIIAPANGDGKHVVKNRVTGEYFRVGEDTCFMLAQLDGQHSAAEIEDAYQRRFGEPLSEAELADFLKMALAHQFVEFPPDAGPATAAPAPVAAPAIAAPDRQDATVANASVQAADAQSAAQQPSTRRQSQSLLAWRKTLVDPDRFLAAVAPAVSWVWSAGFLVVAAGVIAAAGVVLWLNRLEFFSTLATNFQWQTAIMAVVTLLAVTVLHEMAHGLTCKHFGGEVREMGFLLIFFMPSFFCNVSDAWLMPRKSHRLWITFAGGFFELFLWALAVFVWRLTMQDTLVNYLAWTVVSVSGIRVLLNCNPFIKLDGYYLLSDALDIPNLRQASLDRFLAVLRWMCWGGAKPGPQPHARLLMTYGVTCWLFSIGFMGLMLYSMARFLGEHLGPLGACIALVIAVVVVPRLFQGLLGQDASRMLATDPRRTSFWAMTVVATAVVLFCVRIDDYAKGTFEIRPRKRVEVRATIAGFLQPTHLDQGQHVEPGVMIAELVVPDLDSKIAQKRAELEETRATLRSIEAGTRKEEIAEQKNRVTRAADWCRLAKGDVVRGQQAFDETLHRLDRKLEQCKSEIWAAQATLQRGEGLVSKRTISEQQFLELQLRYKVAVSQYQQVEAERAATVSVGNSKAEEELSRREKELADAQGQLALLEAGSRQEEIEAERARLARIQEELSYLEGLQQKRRISSQARGVIITPHILEKAGQYLHEGDLICEVEDCSAVEFEISLPEQEVRDVQIGQSVRLKARALPYETFRAKVDRIAPAAESGKDNGKLQSQVVVYSRLDNPPSGLKAGMMGHAKIETGRAMVAKVLADDLLKYVRTEFWW